MRRIADYMSSISILMATYNGGEFLDYQLESLAHQSKLPAELVVVDDCSTDNTLSIVRQFTTHSPFPVHIYKNHYNKGYRRNFIDGTTLCRSDLIAFCDQDDVWHEDKLLVIGEQFTESSILLAYHNANVVDSNGNFIDFLWPKGSHPDRSDPLTSGPWSYALGFTQTFRRDLLWFSYLWEDSVDHCHPKERLAHDQWLFFLASVFGKIVYLDQELVNYRQHDHNLYGVRWDVSMMDDNVNKRNPISSFFISASGLLEEDGARFAQLSSIAENRGDILQAIAKDKVYLPNIRQQAIAAASQYSALAERLSLRARIYEQRLVINRFVAWCKLLYMKAYGSYGSWSFSVKAAARDALLGIVIGPRARRVVRSVLKLITFYGVSSRS